MQRFDTNAEFHAGVIQWLMSQVADFYRDGIEKLVPWYDNCLNLNGNYVEKYLKKIPFICIELNCILLIFNCFISKRLLFSEQPS